MARPRKLIPSYRKHKASGQAFVELNGRRFYCGVHGTKASKAEYDRLVMEWLASGRHDLQRLSETIGIEIRVAHYPPYCSKYNPIERCFFPHVGRACSGMLFDTIQRVVDLMRRTSTRTGWRTTVNVIRRG